MIHPAKGRGFGRYEKHFSYIDNILGQAEMEKRSWGLGLVYWEVHIHNKDECVCGYLVGGMENFQTSTGEG